MWVRRVGYVSPRLVRITFGGPDLESLSVEHPAASVRLLLPWPETQELVVPTGTATSSSCRTGDDP